PRPAHRRRIRLDDGRPAGDEDLARCVRKLENGAMTIDPIEFEVFHKALDSISDEMALTIYRTAYSGVLKDVMDYSASFCYARGRIVAQGLTLPSHLGSMPDALAATIRRYAGRIAPGDVFCLNDPFEGGMHLPDIFVLRPIFQNDALLAW